MSHHGHVTRPEDAGFPATPFSRPILLADSQNGLQFANSVSRGKQASGLHVDKS
jgi:hypothetical protein